MWLAIFELSGVVVKTSCLHKFRSDKVRERIETMKELQVHFFEGIFSLEKHYPIAPNISRPTSIRLISLVPAPISISLASRKIRPTGLSDRYPAPPIA